MAIKDDYIKVRVSKSSRAERYNSDRAISWWYRRKSIERDK